MNVEATKGGYMLNLLERVVCAVEKFADVADRAVKLEEQRQNYNKTYLHDRPKHPAYPGHSQPPAYPGHSQPHSAGWAPRG
jgi:hypothetical protein